MRVEGTAGRAFECSWKCTFANQIFNIRIFGIFVSKLL